MHKRLRLAKSHWINLSKVGGALSIGWRELTTNISRKGVCKSIGLAGSSLSYQTKLVKLGNPITPGHVVTIFMTTEEARGVAAVEP